MQIVIRALDFPSTGTLRRHAEQRLHSVLTRYGEHILRVAVRLSGSSGLGYGADRCCHVQVQLAGQPDVVVKEVEADLYAAIGRAAHRAGRTVKRRLVRRRNNARTAGLPDAVQPAEQSTTT